MTTESILQAPPIQVRRVKVTAYLLLGLAIAVPFLVAALDGMNAFDTGRLLGQMVVAFVVVVAFVALALRSSTPLAKSYGRLAVAIGFLAWSAGASIGAWRDAHRVTEAKREMIEAFMRTTVAPAQPQAAQSAATVEVVNPSSRAGTTDKMVAFMNGVQIRATKWATDAGALEQKFSAVDMSTVLRPENLTTRPGITASRQKVRQVQELIDERNSTLQRYLLDVAEFFKTADIDDINRREAITSFEAGRQKTLVAYEELGNAQLASLKAVSDMLDFAEKNLGGTSVQNGRIMFQTQAQLDQYQGIFAKLQQAAAEEEAVTKKTLDLQKASRQSLLNEYNKK